MLKVRNSNRLDRNPIAPYMTSAIAVVLLTATAHATDVESTNVSVREAEATRASESGVILAQADDSSERRDSQPLEPRYQPREPEKKSWYNDSYIFGMTRGLADSTIAPAGKGPLFLFTVPLDIVLLPFTVIGGLFG